MPFLLWLAIEKIVASGFSFLQIAYHAHTIEGIRCEAYGGIDNTPRAITVDLAYLDPVVVGF